MMKSALPSRDVGGSRMDNPGTRKEFAKIVPGPRTKRSESSIMKSPMNTLSLVGLGGLTGADAPCQSQRSRSMSR
jgi:hypothetical protein